MIGFIIGDFNTGIKTHNAEADKLYITFATTPGLIKWLHKWGNSITGRAGGKKEFDDYRLALIEVILVQAVDITITIYYIEVGSGRLGEG
ncbi:MAG: hypothetical protein DHS20C18_09690 [Saprospiraceae bacterium]|nr:MAG: hypothetical protein DHS20C18_09690 [Saprospiraceae bacterium]